MRYAFLSFICSIIFISCSQISHVTAEALIDCKYDSNYQLSAYTSPSKRKCIVPALLHPDCDSNCCNTVIIDKIFSTGPSTTLFHINFRPGEVGNPYVRKRGCWVAEGALMLWIIPCHPEGLKVYSADCGTEMVYRLPADQYYKGTLVNIGKSRVLLSIADVDGNLLTQGWVDQGSCICTSANGEC